MRPRVETFPLLVQTNADLSEEQIKSEEQINDQNEREQETN